MKLRIQRTDFANNFLHKRASTNLARYVAEI